MSLLIAETRKLTTVWTTVIITAVGLALSRLGAGFLLFESEFSGEFLGTDGQVADAIDQIGSMSVIALIVGLLSVTTEFRHETIGRTLQLTPSRTRVVVTKMVVGAGYGSCSSSLGLVPIGLLLLVSGGARVRYGPDPDGAVAGSGRARAHGRVRRGDRRAAAQPGRRRRADPGLRVRRRDAVQPVLPSVGRWLPLQALNAMFVPEEMLANLPGGRCSRSTRPWGWWCSSATARWPPLPRSRG
jgi:hypothetical protein